MGLEHVAALLEADARARVQAETWGHLAPEPGRKYRGFIVWVHTAWGEITPIEAEFDGLDCSPWFYEDIMDHIVALTQGDDPIIYTWKGTYVKHKNGRCHFRGGLAGLFRIKDWI